MYSVIATAENKGRAKGIEEGLAKGRAEGENIKALEIAYKLKEYGMSIAEIVRTTGLSEEDIRKIK